MNVKYISYIIITILLLTGGYFFYTFMRDDRILRTELDKIKRSRDSLNTVVADIEARTKQRDKELQKAIDDNLLIIADLNKIIEARKIDIEKLKKRIAENTSTLDSLWNTN